MSKEIKKTYYLYALEADDGRAYIGLTVNPKGREYSHFHGMRYKCHDNDLIQVHYNAGGKFTFRVIASFVDSHKNAIQIERKITEEVAKRTPVFNQKFGVNHTSHTRKKIGSKNKGLQRDAAFCEAVSARMKGYYAGDKNPAAKTVTTPLGVFTTMKAAAKALGINRNQLRGKIYNREEGYSYVK